MGPIPDNRTFAGRIIDSPGRVDLARCSHCRLGFRTVRPTDDELARLYAGGSDSAWSDGDHEARPDWISAARWVQEVDGSSVLDIGCFDGGFLASLPGKVTKAGVELNAGAAERARKRGVEIVASDLHELDESSQRYDVVTAFDVIEHVNEPTELLAAMARRTRPGGCVVIATGNLDAPTWRLVGSRYLYSWFLEHLVFISPGWIRREAARTGLEVAVIERFSHTPGLRGFVVGMLKTVLYRVSPRIFDTWRSRRTVDEVTDRAPGPPPTWAGARDHILVVLRTSG